MSGLPQYLAPEQVRGEGHAYPVDWWALGVLLYELACGRMPFDAPIDDDDADAGGGGGGGDAKVDELQVARAILEHQQDALDFASSNVSELLQDLVVAFLCPDPDGRLGSQGGAAEVKDSPVLAGFDWHELAEGRLKSPLAARAANVIRAGSASSDAPAAAAPDAEATQPDFDAAPPAAAEWAGSTGHFLRNQQ